MSNRALIVGISDYGRPDWNLPGCIRDAREWGTLLQESYGFRGEDITTLEDRQARKADVVRALEALLADAEPGDRRLFIYAGHGTTVPRSSTDEGDRMDALDECLVLHPAQASAPGDYLLSDNDLLELIQARGPAIGEGITIILDSCFSLGMLRLEVPGEASKARVVYVAGDPVGGEGESAGASRAARTRRFGSLRSRADADPAHVLIAAARENEPAWDSQMEDGLRHGVFTYFATRILKEEPSLDNLTLVRRCEARLQEARFPQHPGVAGSVGRHSVAFLTGPAATDGGTEPGGAAADASTHGAHGIIIAPEATDSTSGSRFSLEGPWNIQDPVHEKITERALKRVGIIKDSETFTSKGGWEFIRGVFWNDDPEGYLFDDNEDETDDWSSGYTFYTKFNDYKKAADRGTFYGASPPSPLLARSHFGDLQCLHAMAARNGEAPQRTLSNMLEWAEFLYLVATGHIDTNTRMCDVKQGRMDRWFPIPPPPPRPPRPGPTHEREAGDDRSTARAFNPRTTVGNMLLVWKKGSPRRRAVGALLHMIQDSFCDSHTERNRAWDIVEFHTYVGQDDAKHAAADKLAPGGLRSMPNAMKAADHSETLLRYWQAGRPWETVRQFLVEQVFRLAADVRAASPGRSYRALATPPGPSTMLPADPERGWQTNFTITGYLFKPETFAAPGQQEDFLFGNPVTLSPSGSPVSFSYSQTLAETLELQCVASLDLDARRELQLAVSASLLQGPPSSRVEVAHEELGPFTIEAGTSTVAVTGQGLLGIEGWGASLNVAASNEQGVLLEPTNGDARGPTPRTQQLAVVTLAALHAPILHFHPSEGKQCCYPSDAERAYERFIKSGHFPESRAPKMPDPNTPCYYQYSSQVVRTFHSREYYLERIKYWFWYNFNDFPQGPDNPLGGHPLVPHFPGSHKGDWESVELFLLDRHVLGARFSNHDGGNTFPAPELRRDAAHVHTWVSNGSHANYHSPRAKPYEFQVLGVGTTFSDEIKDGGAIWRTEAKLVEMSQTNFGRENYRGHWGDPVSPVARQFAVSQSDFPPFYTVTVKTSNLDKAGTDARVTLTMFGRGGTRASFRLDNPRDNFERNKTDRFLLDGPRLLGDIHAVDIGHDNSGDNPGWHLDHILITENHTGRTWQARCGAWIDSHRGLKRRLTTQLVNAGATHDYWLPAMNQGPIPTPPGPDGDQPTPGHHVP